MTQYAKISHKSAFLSSEFGEKMARRYFGDEAIDAMPRFVRGKNAGKPKGMITWKKVIEGGWVSGGPRASDGFANGHVERRVNKVIEVSLCNADWGKEPEAIAWWTHK